MKTSRFWLFLYFFSISYYCEGGGVELMVNQELSNQTVIYASISGGKSLPFLPSEPISQIDADKLPSYVEAKYNEKGQLITLTKFIDKKVYFVQSIKYIGPDIKEVIVRNSEGEITRSLVNR